MNAGWGISPWNLVNFTHEIWQISPRFDQWNPPKIIKASVLAKTLQFDECRVGDFTLEIQWVSPWNLVDFNHEIWWISPRFHLWNPPKIIKASVSAKTSVWWMQGRGYDQGFHEIHQISPWNLVDFTCEIQQSSPRFHLWNPPKIIKASVSAKTLQFDECRVGAMTKDFMWNLHEIHWISKLWAFAWWSSIGLSFFERPIRSFCWNIWFYKVWGGFHLKSAGFQVKSKDLLQGIVTLCFVFSMNEQNKSLLKLKSHFYWEKLSTTWSLDGTYCHLWVDTRLVKVVIC